MTLAEFIQQDTNHSCRIEKIHTINLAERLLDIGCTTGSILVVEKIAPLGCPVALSVEGYVFCLRKSELKDIDIQPDNTL